MGIGRMFPDQGLVEFKPLLRGELREPDVRITKEPSEPEQGCHDGSLLVALLPETRVVAFDEVPDGDLSLELAEDLSLVGKGFPLCFKTLISVLTSFSYGEPP